MNVVGDKLIELCSSGQRDLLLVAPFVKATALERLLEAISPSVALQCVTRWKPEEIASGVSDLEIWPLLSTRSNTSLWLRSDLHAKYYRADDQCLLGSANLTNTALGWSITPNLELLIDVSAKNFVLQQFEQTLFDGSIQVNDDIYQITQLAVQSLEASASQTKSIQENYNSPYNTNYFDISTTNWLPLLRNPSDLYLAYSGNYENLINSSRSIALREIQILAAPPNLNRSQFEVYISAILIQMPLVRKVDDFLAKPQRFGSVRDFIANISSQNDPEFDPSRAWQTLMRWLRYFFPNRYIEIPSRHSEVLQRII